MTFEDALTFVLSREGIVSNNPDDAGGLTKFGISSRQYPEVGQSTFTKDNAIAIYKRDYWDRLKCDNLPWNVALVLFDTAVNHGQAQAVYWLQQALKVKADGVVGDATTKAAWAASPDALIDLLVCRAREYARDVNFLHFGRGWMRRLFLLQQSLMKGTS
jgi:lysozyme family protein